MGRAGGQGQGRQTAGIPVTRALCRLEREQVHLGALLSHGNGMYLINTIYSQ